MKKILIMCNVNPNSNPRPNRMIRWLKDDYETVVLSRGEVSMDRVKSYVYNPLGLEQSTQKAEHIIESILKKTGSDYIRSLAKFVLRLVNLRLGRYEEVNWQNLVHARALIPELVKEKFDLIISHDLVLLPLAFQIGTSETKVMLDAREYYPRNYDDRWDWRITKKPVNEHLCKTYLKKCNKVITVSPGLSDEYRREYDIDAEVIMSLPTRQDLQPTSLDTDKIRMIHHGSANPSRKTERMLELMDHLDHRFHLDLMLIKTEISYWNKITIMAKRRANVRIIPPVPMPEIVSATNKYDIGLFLVPPSNFNLTHTLPNKLFEFIQARLAVAIGPNVDMKRIVEKYNCGIVSQDFSPQALARELNKLSPERIMDLKQNSHRAALELNAEVNGERIHEIVGNLIRE